MEYFCDLLYFSLKPIIRRITRDSSNTADEPDVMALFSRVNEKVSNARKKKFGNQVKIKNFCFANLILQR